MARGTMTPGMFFPLGADGPAVVEGSERPVRGGGVATGAGSSGALEIITIEFLSDHKKLVDNVDNWEPKGFRYPKPEWVAGVSHPVTHGQGPVKLEVSVHYSGPRRARWITATLNGYTAVSLGKSAHMTFRSKRVTLKPGLNTIRVEARPGFPNVVQKFDLEIQWMFLGKRISLSVGPLDPGWISAPVQESSHEVFVTLGTPTTLDSYDHGHEDEAITYKRMAYAVKTVGKTKKIAPHAIVKKLLSGFPRFNLHAPEKNAWKLASKAKMEADCRTIVQYITNLIKMIGCPGEAQVVLVYPRFKNPHKWRPKDKKDIKMVLMPDGVQELWFLDKEPKGSDFEAVADPPPSSGTYAGLDKPVLIHPNGKHKAILFAGDGQNSFEGCLRFTHNSSSPPTKLYAGGVGVFTTKEDVLKVFTTFSWSVLDKGDPDTPDDDKMVPVKTIMPPWP